MNTTVTALSVVALAQAHMAIEEKDSTIAKLQEENESLRAKLKLIMPTSHEIDDLAFGYVPSGKIGELREFAEALLALFQDKVAKS